MKIFVRLAATLHDDRTIPYNPGNRRQVFEHDQKKNKTSCEDPRWLQCRATVQDYARFTPDGPRSPEIHPSQVVVRHLKAGVTWALANCLVYRQIYFHKFIPFQTLFQLLTGITSHSPIFTVQQLKHTISGIVGYRTIIVQRRG